jgi:pSer/pThr/pTyr-binding forkhead associated (FHA) protein/S1-C subfamily serine protease
MTSIIFKFVSGVDIGKEYRREIKSGDKIIIGREADSTVLVSELEEMVSRKHAVIEFVGDDAVLSDASTHGTFVNRVKCTAPKKLEHGSVFRLGLQGPEIVVSYDPSRAKATVELNVSSHLQNKKTKEFDQSIKSITGERNSAMDLNANESIDSTSGSTTAKGVGKATLEREIKKEVSVSEAKSKKLISIIIAVATLSFVLASIGFLIYKKQSDEKISDAVSMAVKVEAEATEQAKKIAQQQTELDKNKIMTSEEIKNNYGASVVQIRTTWRLINNFGQQYYIKSNKNGEVIFTQDSNKNISPYLTTQEVGADGRRNIPVVGSTSGTGFVVISDGTILTNLHVAAGWTGDLSSSSECGPLIQTKDGALLKETHCQKLVMPASQSDSRSGVGENVVGEVIKATVRFPNSATDIPASLGILSLDHDVATLKIHVPTGNIKPLPLAQAEYPIVAGLAVAQLGYPGESGEDVKLVTKKDTDSKNVLVTKDVSIKEGIVSKASSLNRQVASAEKNTLGDYIELDIANSPGNSGGPLIDKKSGKVIGIISAKNTLIQNGRDAGSVTLAVPINYALKTLYPTAR